MFKHAKGLRGLLTAVIVIVLSAGAAAAAGPSGHAHGLATAAEKAGKTVPVAAQEAAAPDETTDGTEETEPAEPVEPTQDAAAAGGDHCATDPRTLNETELAALNHGAIVCWAAHQETPAEFANHGAWVSSWAKKNHGSEQSAAAHESHGKP